MTLEGGGDAVLGAPTTNATRNLRLIGGGNDLFVTVGIVLLTAGFLLRPVDADGGRDPLDSPVSSRVLPGWWPNS